MNMVHELLEVLIPGVVEFPAHINHARFPVSFDLITTGTGRCSQVCRTRGGIRRFWDPSVLGIE